MNWRVLGFSLLIVAICYDARAAAGWKVTQIPVCQLAGGGRKSLVRGRTDFGGNAPGGREQK